MLLAIKQVIDAAKAQQQTVIDPIQIADYEQCYGAILQASMEEEHHDPPPPSGQREREKQSKSKHLLDRFQVILG